MRPKMIGSINCYWPMSVDYKGKKVGYNGTTLDLCHKLEDLGAIPGDTFTDEDGKIRRVKSAPGDTRTKTQIWVTTWNLEY